MDGYRWVESLSCAITVCDRDAVVIYQNEKAKRTFESYGSLIGKNLRDCHAAASWDKICELLNSGGSNSYTIEKRGVKKLIYQTPWYESGKIMGLVELSMEIPFDMPHHIRK